jgi:DNA-binding YbaB/EbfC family protein
MRLHMDENNKLGFLFEQAKKLQEKMTKLQEEAGEKTVEGNAGGGMVKVIANGHGTVISVHIDPELIKMNDAGMIEDMVTAAVNQALANARAMMQNSLKALTGGINIPGLF